MHSSRFDAPTLGTNKVSLPHVSILNGPLPEAAAPAVDAQRAAPAAGAALILVGLDDQGKPHASWFEEEQADAAAVAADLMGFAVIDISLDELAAIASKLPKGKLFESGKAFVPFVKRELYELIAAHLPEADRAKAEQIRVAPDVDTSQQEQPVKPNNLPEDWSKITIGSLVLATDDPLDGWYEATVIEMKPDDVLRLRWRHYLDLPPFNRRLEDVALLHPSVKL